jgi:hypothetical protein
MLSRPVLLYACKDGTLTFEPVWGPVPAGTGDWREIAIDLIFEGKIDSAAGVLVENRDEPILETPQEAPLYSLPFFSVDTAAQARTVRARFCKLMAGSHPYLPAGEPWYVLNQAFGGHGLLVDELATIAEDFARFLSVLDRRARRRAR